MRASRVSAALLTTLLLAACVTINVYFPAAAAEKAADRIIRNVYGSTAAEKPKAEPAPKTPPVPQSLREDRHEPLLVVALDWLVPPAQAAANINIQTPAIQSLQASMAGRFPQLKPYFDSGAIGMTNSGLITVRNLNAVPLRDRRQLQQLVAAENQDRNALYKEIARANGHPEWEGEIRGTFARRWVANAPGGWWYQDGSGSWRQK
ncbi:MAG: YdbL family protein [Gammaproteobacteria bacterium]